MLFMLCQLGGVILETKITALCFFSLFVKIFKLKLKSVMQALDITLLGLRPRVGVKLLDQRGQLTSGQRCIFSIISVLLYL